MLKFFANIQEISETYCKWVFRFFPMKSMPNTRRNRYSMLTRIRNVSLSEELLASSAIPFTAGLASTIVDGATLESAKKVILEMCPSRAYRFPRPSTATRMVSRSQRRTTKLFLW